MLPVLFYIIDLFPFFISNSEHKVAVMNDNLNNPSLMFRVVDGWIALNGFHFIFRYLWASLLLIWITAIIFRNRKITKQSKGSLNKSLFWFIAIISVLQIPLIIPELFGVLFHLKWYTLHFISLNLSMVLLATTYSYFFRLYTIWIFA